MQERYTRPLVRGLSCSNAQRVDKGRTQRDERAFGSKRPMFQIHSFLSQRYLSVQLPSRTCIGLTSRTACAVSREMAAGMQYAAVMRAMKDYRDG